MVMDNIQELVQLGKNFFESKEYSKAERYFKQVLRFNKRYADIHNMLGIINHIEGKFNSAIDSFKEAIKINPKYTEALLNLAVLYNDLGEYKEAKKIYSALQKNPQGKKQEKEIEPVLKGKLSNMHADIGDVYRSLGLYDFAAEEYNKGLLLNPDYIDIRTKLGTVLRESGQPAESVKELKTVLKNDPKYAHARIQLGVTYYSQKKFNEAKKEWGTVLKQDPTNESAKMYIRLGNAVPRKKAKH